MGPAHRVAGHYGNCCKRVTRLLKGTYLGRGDTARAVLLEGIELLGNRAISGIPAEIMLVCQWRGGGFLGGIVA